MLIAGEVNGYDRNDSDVTLAPLPSELVNSSMPNLSFETELLMRKNKRSCSLTLTNYTWQFDKKDGDESIEGITKKACAMECLSKPWCSGYTWSKDSSSGSICHLFKTLKNQHECDPCAECLSGKITHVKGICSEKWIAAQTTDSELACLSLCVQNPNCQYYTYSIGNVFHDTCFLFEKCTPLSSCEQFQTGKLDCIEPPTSRTTTTMAPFITTDDMKAVTDDKMFRKEQCEVYRSNQGKVTLDCGSSVIEIVYGNYGRTNSAICPGVNSNASNCCNCEGGLDKIKDLCNGMTSCKLQAKNSFFGDPCVGIYKYLEVKYRCVDAVSK